MKAFTVWQPWASLIMIGAKPWEFRKWDFQKRGIKIGQRLVLHAGARPMRAREILDLVVSIENGQSSLVADKALPVLRRLYEQLSRKETPNLPLSVALGTVGMGKARDMAALFKRPDSNRLDHHMFAWPMIDPKPYDEPVPMRGLQGFFNVPDSMDRAA